MPTLGNRLTSLLMEINGLIIQDNDPETQAELEDLHSKVCRKLQALIDKKIPTNTVKYKAATEALKKANTALKKAKKDIQKVADAIEKVAQAVKVLGKLTSALA